MIGLGRAVDLSVACGPARHWIIGGYYKVYFIRFWTRYTGGKSPIFRGGFAEFSVEPKYSFHIGLVWELPGRV